MSESHNHAPSASLNKTLPFAPASLDAEGIFIPTSVKFVFVSALLWAGLITGSVCAWYGAWTIGVKVAGWLA